MSLYILETASHNDILKEKEAAEAHIKGFYSILILSLVFLREQLYLIKTYNQINTYSFFCRFMLKVNVNDCSAFFK